MAIDDTAVIVAAVGYVFVNDTPGAVPPSPSELAALNPESYGSQTSNIKLTGTPAGGTFTVTVATQVTSALPYNVSLSAFQTAIEALSSVGTGNTLVTGTSISDSNGFSVSFVGPLQGMALTVTATGTSLTGGTTPAAVASLADAVNSWRNVGHTSRNDLPVFGFDGGKLEMKGTWQNERLREVQQTSNPIEDSVTVILEQWDPDTFELYFGADVADTPGIFGVDGQFIPVEKAVLVIIIDGDTKIGFYAPKASIQRDSAAKMTVDDFATFPIKATFLNLGTRRLYDWINEDLFASS